MQTKHWIEFLVDGRWIFEHEIDNAKTLLSRIERTSNDLATLKKELESLENQLVIDVLKQYSPQEILEAKNKAN